MRENSVGKQTQNRNPLHFTLSSEGRGEVNVPPSISLRSKPDLRPFELVAGICGFQFPVIWFNNRTKMLSLQKIASGKFPRGSLQQISFRGMVCACIFL